MITKLKKLQGLSCSFLYLVAPICIILLLVAVWLITGLAREDNEDEYGYYEEQQTNRLKRGWHLVPIFCVLLLLLIAPIRDGGKYIQRSFLAPQKVIEEAPQPLPATTVSVATKEPQVNREKQALLVLFVAFVSVFTTVAVVLLVVYKNSIAGFCCT